MYKRGLWYKRLCFLLTLCMMITSVFSVAAINGYAAPEGKALQPEVSAVREIIQGTLSLNAQTEPYSYKLIAQDGKVIPLTGDTDRMKDYIRANISAAGYYDNTGSFYVEAFVLQSEGNHVMVSNNLMYFNDPTDQNDYFNKIKGNVVAAWDSNFVKYFRASVITEMGSYEISLVDVLSTTDPEVRVGIFNIYSGGNLVEKCIKGTLYQLFPNSDGYFKFYSDGASGKQWHVSGRFSSRYDYGIAPTYSPTPTESIKFTPTPTESTPTPTESTITATPTPTFATPNPLVETNIKIQLTSNNFDYVYYYFNKLPDTAKENKIYMTTKAYAENAEIFSIEDAGDGKVFLKAISPEGNVDGYLSVDSDGRVVINTSLTPENPEMFELNYQMGWECFNLKSSYNGKFVCADVFSGYSVTADRDAANEWETFSANMVPDIIPTPTPTELNIIPTATPTESTITATPIPTESIITPTPTPTFATPNPLVGKNIKIQLTSNNFDYVYYYFNKLPDTAKENKIGMTTKAYVENAEIFSIADAGDGKIFLKAISPEGNVDGYLSVDSDGRVVINTALTPENPEMFELSYQTGLGYFNLKSVYNGKFVCADVFSGYSVTADRDVASVWETFNANIVPDIIPTPSTITPQTPVTTPPTAKRPQTPSVKRTPGPTELDVIYTISGIVKAGDGNINLDDCNISILGTGISQTGSSFKFNTLYSCGKLRISKPGYLTRDVQIEKFIYGPKDVLIFAGDINQDNAINMQDIMLIAKSFNSKKGDEIFNKVCDLNGDKVINMSDIMLGAVYFNRISADYEKLSDGLSTSEFKLEFDVEQAKEISKYSADIKGAIYNMSVGRCVTPVWIEYWEESDPSKVTMTDSDMIFYYPDFIARTINGLKPGTTYKYRVNSGVGSSDIKSFTTLPDNIETRLSISYTYPYTHTVILSAKLEDIAGNPIVNKKISCYNMEAVTRDNGEALFNINVAAQEDYGHPYIDVKASFAGDDKYLNCEAEKRITLNSQSINMKYEEINGFYTKKDGEFVIQNNQQFNERFMYIWDHNPIPERRITNEEFQYCIVLGVGKFMSANDSLDKLNLTLDKIIYSAGTYKVFYSYKSTGGSLSQGIYRMALVEKLPFTQVEFYENETLVKTIIP